MKAKYDAEQTNAPFAEMIAGGSTWCRRAEAGRKTTAGVIRKTVAAAAAAISLGAAGTASATIMLTVGNTPQQPGQENILFNGDGTISGPALVVSGRTNQSDTLVAFESDENLVTPASGQARVDAEDDAFDDLSVYLLEGGTFSSLIFNLDATDDGTAVITVSQLVGADAVFNVDLDGAGQNFFTLVAEDGQLMTRVDIETDVEIELAEARQFRIDIGEPNGVPEPSALWLAGLGLLGLARLGRRAAGEA